MWYGSNCMQTKVGRDTVSHPLGDSLLSKLLPGRDGTCCVKSCSFGILCHIRSQLQFQKFDCNVFRNLGHTNIGRKGRFNITCEVNNNTRWDYHRQWSYGIELLSHIRSQLQFQKIDCNVFRNLGHTNIGRKGRFKLTCEVNNNTRWDYHRQWSYGIELLSLLRSQSQVVVAFMSADLVIGLSKYILLRHTAWKVRGGYL